MKQLNSKLATFVMALAVSAPSFADQQMQVGVVTHVNSTTPLQNALKTLNVGFRAEVQWTRIERTANNLSYAASFATLDQLISDARSRQESPVILLPAGNPLYDGGGQLSSPEAMKAFARYAQFVTQQMKGRANQIEVWNEWEEGGGATKTQTVKGDPVAYANLLKAAYPAIKAANSSAIVIGTGIQGNDMPWVRKFAAAGGLQYLDAFAIHPYVQCNSGAPQAPSHFRITSSPTSKGAAVKMVANTTAAPALKILGGTPEQSMTMVDELNDTLGQLAPTRSIPIYITEIGWPTATNRCGVTESMAAAYLQRFMLLAGTRPYIAGVWWYDIFDDGADPNNSEQRFGLMQQNQNTPKAAYNALLALKSILQSAHRPTQSVGAQGEIIVSGAQADGKQYYASWLPINASTATQSSGVLASKVSSGFHAMASASTSSPAADSLSTFPQILVQQ